MIPDIISLHEAKSIARKTGLTEEQVKQVIHCLNEGAASRARFNAQLEHDRDRDV